MKLHQPKLFIIFLIILSPFISEGQIKSSKQLPLNNGEKKEKQNAYQKYLDADSTLHVVYNEVLQEYKKDTFFIKKISESQEIWKNLRKANVNSIFPNDSESNYYGTAEITCRYIFLAQETNQRIQFLQQWLNGIPEGDVCAGSRKYSKATAEKRM